MSETSSLSMSTPSPVPLKVRLFLSLVSFVTSLARRPDGTANRRLLALFDLQTRPTPNARRGVRSVDLSIDPLKNLWARVYYPVAAAATADPSLPVVVFFHGGGFCILAPGSKDVDAFCRRISGEVGAVVVSVNYRLAPEHKWPAPYEDGLDVLRWIERNPSFNGFARQADISRIFLAGDSAGANIAHHVAALFSAWRAGYPAPVRVRVLGLVTIQPFWGGEERTESETRLAALPMGSMELSDWLWRAFLPEGSDRDHVACNVCGTKSTAALSEHFPATLVIVGGLDPLQDRQRKYVEWLREKEVDVEVAEYEKAVHAFFIFPELPESGMLMSAMRDFVRSGHSAVKAQSTLDGST